MPLNINDYIEQTNKWTGIREYILSMPEKYSIYQSEKDIDKSIYRAITKNAQLIFSSLPKIYDSFRKGIGDLKNDKRQIINRKNCLLLIFALNIDSISEADRFLINFLHENRLSAKNLNEFIIMSGLHLNLDAETIITIQEEYSHIIDIVPTSSRKIAFNQTIELEDDIFAFNTKDDLKRFLNDEINISRFALTRNTQYLALFGSDLDDDTDWYNIIYSQTESSIDRSDNVINYIISAFCDEYEGRDRLRKFYNKFFSLYCTDDRSDEQNIILPDEVESLSKYYPDTFYTYETFYKTIMRERVVDINSGIYILRILELLEADDSYDFSSDFLDYESTIEDINELLLNSGFSTLNDKDSFCRLVLDTYKESLEYDNPQTSVEAKSLFLTKLRFYLKLIANN